MPPLDVLSALIGFQSVSREPNAPIVGWIADILEDSGARVSVLPAEAEGKANLIASIGPDRADGVVVSGHTDVVPVDGQDWSSDPFILVERDGRLYGRGTADMKGFVALAVALAPEFAALPLRRPIHIVLTHDEEVGCLGAPALLRAIVDRGLDPAIAIIGEPTGMQPVNGHKGCEVLRIEVTGRAAHSSDPGNGHNAILTAVEAVAFLKSLFDELSGSGVGSADFDPPWSTFNIGRIDGGEAVNIVAERCLVDWEFRTVPGDDPTAIRERIERHIRTVLEPGLRRRHPAGSVRLHRLASVPMLAPEPGGAAESLVRQLTGRNVSRTVAFGSEAGFFQAAGMSTVVCGPGDIAQAHQPDEFLTLAQFREGERFLRALGEWCAR